MVSIETLYGHIEELVKQDVDNILVDMIEYGTPRTQMRQLFVSAINNDSGGQISGATVTIDNEYVETTALQEDNNVCAIIEVPIKDSYHINITADEFSELDEDINITDVYVTDYVPNDALEGSKRITLYMYYE